VEAWAAEGDSAADHAGRRLAVKFERGDREGFRSHRWEGGVLTGDYAGATL